MIWWPYLIWTVFCNILFVGKKFHVFHLFIGCSPYWGIWWLFESFTKSTVFLIYITKWQYISQYWIYKYIFRQIIINVNYLLISLEMRFMVILNICNINEIQYFLYYFSSLLFSVFHSLTKIKNSYRYLQFIWKTIWNN